MNLCVRPILEAHRFLTKLYAVIVRRAASQPQAGPSGSARVVVQSSVLMMAFVELRQSDR